MKLLIYLTLCALTHSEPQSRLGSVNRMQRPVSFRPGVMLKQWHNMRSPPGVIPHYIYRSYPQKYSIKQYTPPRLRGHMVPLKASTRPSVHTTEYEFVRAASAPTHDGGTGAIHTIPAPNLSLLEKPIVVVDSDGVTESSKPVYEVTEKYPDPFHKIKIDQPIGFAKATTLSPELQTLVHNGAALQFASQYGLNAVALPHSVVNHPQFLQGIMPTQVISNPIVPQAFSLQGINQNQQEIFHASPEALVISPNAMYQADPHFLQKLTNLIIQNFPGVQFVPYPAEVHGQQTVPQVNQPHILQTSFQTPQPEYQAQDTQVHIVRNEPVTRQPPSSFVPSDAKVENLRNVVQRNVNEGNIVTIPEIFSVNNTDKLQVQPLEKFHNITLELVASESQPATTTIKYIVETSTEEEKTTPIYYAPVGETVGNVVANGFYNAINDVRNAATLAELEKSQEEKLKHENNTTTPSPVYYVPRTKKDNETDPITQMKPLGIGVPFAKPPETVKVGYTVLRSEVKDPVISKDGTVYGGQIVEATVSEDNDYIQKDRGVTNRAPLRIVTVTEKIEADTTTNAPKKVTVVKGKLPPKSKLTFDDKTGEPVLRIYASYLPMQKDLLHAKPISLKPNEITRKQDIPEAFNAASAGISNLDKTQGFDGNQVTEFGLKLRSRSDDYQPLFEYDEDYELGRNYSKL